MEKRQPLLDCIFLEVIWFKSKLFDRGVPLDLPAGNELGDLSAPFVIEGDEYDSAFFDKRSKFIHYVQGVNS